MRRRGSKIAKYIERDYKIKKAFENREQKRQGEKQYEEWKTKSIYGSGDDATENK